LVAVAVEEINRSAGQQERAVEVQVLMHITY
jgi:hypothetical protein